MNTLRFARPTFQQTGSTGFVDFVNMLIILQKNAELGKVTLHGHLESAREKFNSS